MPLKLDIKRTLTARSDRVKCVDLHPSEPWMLVSLYNGNVHIWNYESQQLIKTFEVCDLPVRAAKFIPRKNWIVTGSDDMQVRVFNYNTLERVHAFDAHSDYVRCIAVHPTQPIILTGSDDMSIKMWNWEKNWASQKVFEGHSHYVMQIVFNPKDNNTFASASLDRTVKVWQLGSSTPNFTLEGHEKGVNCLDYYHAGEKPYLISGADDRLVKIWDYQNKSCIQTLEGHVQNISAVAFHPELPIILTGSEDGTVKVWHSNTYRLENTLNYGLERVWAICCLKGSNTVGIGYDEGSVLIRLGREEPAFSMDTNGKVVWAKHSEMQQVNFKQLSEDEIKDGERLPLAVKDMGNCEVYPQTVSHNSNGRYVAVCGDGEYIVYTAMALRNKCYGPGQEFVWGADPEEYAIRESVNSVKTFKKLKEKKTFKPELGAEGIYGGALLGVRSANHLTFYDWNNLDLIRRIEIQPKGVHWAENGEMVAITTEESFYVLKYNPDVVSQGHEETQTEDGFEEAFDVVGEVQEYAKTGLWVGDCFIYTNSLNRLNYYVGGEIVTLCHLDRPFYLLGYIPKDNRVYLCDKELNVVSYSLHLSVLEFETAVMRKDIETAEKLLPMIPKEYRTKIAHFLEKQGFVSQALVVSTDPEHKFDLALRLGNLDLAIRLAAETGSDQKWRQLADASIQKGRLDLAEKCYESSQDFGALLLLGTSGGSFDKVAELAEVSHVAGKHNIAFTAYMLTGQLNKALDTLIQTNRLPEAAFFARTYLPSEASRVVQLWRSELHKRNPKMAQSIADPAEYKNLFLDFDESLEAQRFLERNDHFVPARQYPLRVPNQDRKILEEMARASEEGYSVPDPISSYQENGFSEPVITPHAPPQRVDLGPADDGLLQKQTAAAPVSHPSKPAELLTDEDIELDLENMTLDENIDYSDIREEDLLDD